MDSILELIRRFLRWLVGLFFPSPPLPPLKPVADLSYRISDQPVPDALGDPNTPVAGYIAIIPYTNPAGQNFELRAACTDRAALNDYCLVTKIALAAEANITPHVPTPVEIFIDRMLDNIAKRLDWGPTSDMSALSRRVASDTFNTVMEEEWSSIRADVTAAETSGELTSDAANEIRNRTESLVGGIRQQFQTPPDNAPVVSVMVNWLDRTGPAQPFRLRFQIDPPLTKAWQPRSLNSYWRGNITFASVSVSTRSGDVGVDLYRNGMWANGGKAAAAASREGANYTLYVFGLTNDPNVYTMTGTWEAF